MNDLRFPLEINRMIFGYLNQHDLVTAMAVNRNWRHHIETNHLFDTVYMHSHAEFNRFMSINRAYQWRGDTVRRLMIDIDQISRDEADALPFLIRNLDELYFYPKRSFSSLPLTEYLRPHPWSERIKKIYEIASCVFTKSILLNQVCPNLTDISVSGIGRNFTIDEHFIGILINARGLISLKLSHFRFSISSLEILHDHMPQLSTLTLSDGIFLPGQQIVNRPAANLTKLYLYSVSMSRPAILRNFQEYMTAKYPNISVLEHDISVTGQDAADNVFRDLIERIGPQLTSFKIGLSAYYNHAITELIRIGQTGLLQFSTRASTEILLNQQLVLLRRLEQDVPLNTLSLNDIDNDSFINHLVGYVDIHTLNLSARDTVGIDMEALLQAVGHHIQKLHLSLCIVNLDRWNVGDPQQWRNLTHLVLGSTSTSDAGLLDDFIASSFPSLTHLKLDAILDQVNLFQLGRLELHILEIRVALPLVNQEDHEYQYIRVETENRVQFYTAKPLYMHRITEPFDRLTFPEITSSVNEIEQQIIRMDVRCRTIRSFFLVNILGP